MALTNAYPGQNTARKVAMAGMTFAVAMGIGFFMQQREADAAFTPPVPVPTQTAQLAPVVEQPSVEAASSTALPAAVRAAAPVEPAEPTLPSLKPAPQVDLGLSQALVEPEKAPAPVPEIAMEPDCTVQMRARTTDAALVELTLTAPCDANAAVTIHHEGMMFTAQTDVEGRATLIAPAFTTEAVFLAAFDGGAGAIATADVPALDDFDRFAVQWRGDGGFELHAMEFGATYGEPGHVWLDAPRSASAAATGDGGFMMVLGDGRVADARFAQVYTFPAERTARDGRVALSVEAEVTDANCAQTVEAQTLQLRGAASAVKIADVTLAVPGCDAVGNFLVLKNLLPDLKLTRG